MPLPHPLFLPRAGRGAGLCASSLASLSRLLSLLLLLTVAGATVTAYGRGPNVVLIVADDLGYGELGSYGQQRIATPELDKLAQQGLRFTQFYAGSAVCAPSRSVLMTGLHTGHTMVRGNSPIQNYPGQRLQPGTVTVGTVFKQAGYRTAVIGKWGLGDKDTSGAPWKQGFDEFFGFLSQTHAHNHYPDHLWRNDKKVALDNDLVPMGKVAGVGYSKNRREYANDLFFTEAERFVERNQANPFFLYLALTLPHANDERAQALGDGQEVPDYGDYAKESWPSHEKGQAAMITRMDHRIGVLLKRLRELGLEENTVVMFTSDNGPHREGGPGYDPEFFNANGAWRGIKRDLTEGGIRVPFIVRWPGVVSPGKVSAAVGDFTDLLPTCAELAGVEIPSPRDGVSLASSFRGDSSSLRARESLYWEFYEGGFQQAVLLHGRWKALRGRPGGKPFELYDLENDPAEERDVSEANPEVAKRCGEIMAEAHVPSPWWPDTKAAVPASK